MQITQTLAKGLKREFKVTFTSQEVQNKFNQQLQKIGTNVKLPGFRPGMVPASLLEQRYGEETLRKVIETSIEDASSQIIKEHELRPSLSPQVEVEAFDRGKDLIFSLKYEILPEFKEIKTDKLELEQLVLTLDEKQVKESLDNIAKRNRKTKPISPLRKAKKGDIVIIDYEGPVGNQKIEGGQDKDARLELGSGSFIPGFEEQIIGKEKGDQFVIEVTFPKEYHQKDLAGKKAKFNITLKDIHQEDIASIDDNFAKELGFKGLEPLKDSLRQQIKKHYDTLGFKHVKRKLLDILADRHENLEVPSRMVEVEFENIWHQLQHEMGIDHDCSASNQTAKSKGSKAFEDATGRTEEELRKEYHDIAERRVRLGLLLAEIGKRNNITISSQELREALWDQARQYPGQEKEILEYYRKNESALATLRAPLFEDKVVHFILQQAKVSERSVSAEQMIEITSVDSDDMPSRAKAQPKKSTKKTTKKT